MTVQVPPNCDLTLGLTCIDKSVPGTTVWSMRVDERFLNPAGIIQGGFLAAMLDSAMGASAVTSAGEVLTCTAKVLKPGSVISFLEAKILNSQGKLVATASSSYLIRERAE